MKVLITGANRGIGLEFCKEFSQKGYEVIAVCRKKSPELEKLNISVIENIDVTNDASLENLKKQIQGPLDILINNAGIYIWDSLDDINYKNLSEQFEVNSIAPLKVSISLLPLLKKGSKIIMITSQMGSIENTSEGRSYGYRASKAALNMFAKTLAIDLKEKEISVGIFHPGYVKTNMTHQLGNITTKQSVEGLLKLIDNLTIENSGSFWHTNGKALPW